MRKDEKQGLNTSKRTLLLGVAAGASLLLTGCPLLFVGGVATGAAVAFDRRSSGVQVDDKMISLHIYQEIAAAVKDVHVTVNSYNRRVLLTGEVRNAEQKAQVEAIARKEDNVREVVNALAIGPNTSMGSRSNDTYLTGKVKAALTGAEGISAGDVKVITERSVVYLMGLLTEREAAVASGAVATVGGVRQVVRVLEIISEAELRKINERVEERGTPLEEDTPG